MSLYDTLLKLDREVIDQYNVPPSQKPEALKFHKLSVQKLVELDEAVKRVQKTLNRFSVDLNHLRGYCVGYTEAVITAEDGIVFKEVDASLKGTLRSLRRKYLDLKGNP